MNRGLYISIIGGGQCTAEQYRLAEEMGRQVAELGATVVCGGLGGIMEAAARGAKEGGGATVGILPGYDRSPANPYIDVVITTGLGHARNLAVVSSGTLSEIALARKSGRPVIVLSGWRLARDEGTPGIIYADTPLEAMALLKHELGLERPQGLPPDL